jgi:hypothetical protein
VSRKDKKIKNCRLGTVGGQAVLEGVMMKGKEKYSIAVRREDGSISLSENYHTSVRQKYKILGLPIIRGIVGFVELLQRRAPAKFRRGGVKSERGRGRGGSGGSGELVGVQKSSEERQLL